MVRAAVYARYSSSVQRPTSLEDQVARCREAAARLGCVIADEHVYSDQEISGATTMRPGYQRLVEAAKRRLFGAIIVEDQDRLWRDQAEMHAALKRLRFWDVKVFTVTAGTNLTDKTGSIVAALKGWQDETFLDSLREKTRRGMRGQVDRGLSAGGRAHGYRSEPVLDPARRDPYGQLLEPRANGLRQQPVGAARDPGAAASERHRAGDSVAGGRRLPDRQGERDLGTGCLPQPVRAAGARSGTPRGGTGGREHQAGTRQGQGNPTGDAGAVEARIERLRTESRTEPEQGTSVRALPTLVEQYVRDLRSVLGRDTDRARFLLSRLLGDVVLRPDAQGLVAEVRGNLGVLLEDVLQLVPGARLVSFRTIGRRAAGRLQANCGELSIDGFRGQMRGHPSWPARWGRRYKLGACYS